MQNDLNLVGVWTTRTKYHSIPDSEATLIFKSDGTGGLKFSNAYEWEINFFHWAHTSTNWIVLTGIKRLEPHIYTRKTIEVPLSFEIEHLSYEILQSSEQLQIDWPQAHESGLDLNKCLFELINLDADTQNTDVI